MGIDSIGNQQELTKNTLVGLSAAQPLRKNFFKFFHAMADYAKQYGAAQTMVYFTSKNQPNFQIYGLQMGQGGEVISFSTKPEEIEKMPLNILRDQFGLFEVANETITDLKTLFPLDPGNLSEGLAILRQEGKLYLVLTQPLINDIIGQPKGKAKGFVYRGLNYGYLRSYVELPSQWLDALKEQTGMQVSLYTQEQQPGFGFLNQSLEPLTFESHQIFETLVDDQVYLNIVKPLTLGSQVVAYLIVSTPKAELLSQLWDSALIICGVGLVTMILSVLFALPITGILTRPLQQISVRMAEISQGGGDLTQKLHIASNDEVGDLAKNFNHFLQSIHGIIQQIKGASTTLSETMAFMAEFSEEMNVSAEQIVEAVQSQNELSHTIHTTTESTQKTIEEISGEIGSLSQMAKEITEVHAVEGEKAVKTSIDNVSLIKDSFDKINQSLSIITDISNQTNLLSLNAAIEAAKAGEQGKGFAVVADEVRILAERSSKATGEISHLIDESKQRMEAGQQSSLQVQEKIHTVITSINSTKDRLDQLSGSFLSMMETISDTVYKIKDLDSLSETNASAATQMGQSLVEQKHNSKHIAEICEQLNTLVHQFVIE